MTTWNEIKTLSADQLVDTVVQSKKELFKLKTDAHLQKKAEKPHLFKAERKKIARAFTALNQLKRA